MTSHMAAIALHISTLLYCIVLYYIVLYCIIRSYTKGVNPGGDGVMYPPPCFDMGGGITCHLSPHVLTHKSVFFCSGKLIMFYNVCF